MNVLLQLRHVSDNKNLEDLILQTVVENNNRASTQFISRDLNVSHSIQRYLKKNSFYLYRI